ncbi:hypothetical protein GCM10007304_10100 [Rhodococcoides trifolii]|uniref:Uncharacterized protein n=2 Tax=Rhodococcoides trifolii TaxID=908250 RepID=A0A917CUJ0_9NOCA|nr:hypothetical protein GCM10007304_10100 [Rhodococcus trifolii]
METVATPTVVTKTVTVPVPPSITSASTCPGPVNRGTGASAFEGSWRRHASQLVLQRDTATSALMMGASAVDSENWRVDWTHDECDSRKVVVTLLERTALYGTGVDGELDEGKTFGLEFGTSSIGTSVIVTTGLGDDPGVYTWCGADSGPVPECGA